MFAYYLAATRRNGQHSLGGVTFNLIGLSLVKFTPESIAASTAEFKSAAPGRGKGVFDYYNLSLVIHRHVSNMF